VQRSILGRIGAFVRLGRPLFLVGGIVLYTLGATIAASIGHPVMWARFAWGQIAVTSTQLMVHYSNDYFDFEADQANATPTEWSGGSRVLPNGELPRWVALVAALTLAAIALFSTALLEFALGAGATTTALLLVALVLSWEYSAPPLRFHSSGMGEFVAMLIVTLLVPLVGFSAQTGTLELVAFLSAAPLCFLQFAMLLAVEFPDEAGDTAVGKRTLVVRLGAARAAGLYVASIVLAYALLPLCVRLGLPTSSALGLCMTLPLAAWLGWRVIRGDYKERRRWNRLEFASAALVTVAALIEVGAFGQLASRQNRERPIEEPRKAGEDEERALANAGAARDREHGSREKGILPEQAREIPFVGGEGGAIGISRDGIGQDARERGGR
jgi:1,4-dihydroxy-2-naphthoate octaprenyltransferase